MRLATDPSERGLLLEIARSCLIIRLRVIDTKMHQSAGFGFVWFISFMWLVWFKHIHETNQSNQPVPRFTRHGPSPLADFLCILL